MKNFPQLGFQIPDVLLPKPDIDMTKWSVIACDQYTSQPSYWENVSQIVGNSPSTFHMILPEIYLDTPAEAERITSTQQSMQRYLEKDVFFTHQGIILVERTTSNHVRHGIMLALDLEQYDFHKGSQTLIRSTEGTIIERLPPRIRIRENALLEMPHILVLIDDPRRTVIEPIVANKQNLPKLYDFGLMLDGGHISGFSVDKPVIEKRMIDALLHLVDPATFSIKYQVPSSEKPLLFAMGDGNHSLATAKAIWDKKKSTVGMDHPSRYALVEVENIHDEGLEFEPIHRVLFDLKNDFLSDFQNSLIDRVSIEHISDRAKLFDEVNRTVDNEHRFGLIDQAGLILVKVKDPQFNLSVGTLQDFLDRWLQTGGAEKIDYVHGEEVVFGIGSKKGNLGIYLPPMEKNDLFKTVIKDGVLPRKTFSMGSANDKRFYLECRKIT